VLGLVTALGQLSTNVVARNIACRATLCSETSPCSMSRSFVGFRRLC
jgi:hypothetical protein